MDAGVTTINGTRMQVEIRVVCIVRDDWETTEKGGITVVSVHRFVLVEEGGSEGVKHLLGAFVYNLIFFIGKSNKKTH